MSSNRLAFAALGLACIASAAGGGYLATRQNTVPTPAAAMSPAVAVTPAAAPVAPAPATVAPERSVQETEAVVADTAKKSTVAPKPTAARRVESQSGAPRAASTPACHERAPGSAASAGEHVAVECRITAAGRAAPAGANRRAAIRIGGAAGR